MGPLPVWNLIYVLPLLPARLCPCGQRARDRTTLVYTLKRESIRSLSPSPDIRVVKFPKMALFREKKLFLQKAGVWKDLKDSLREESQQGGRGASSQGSSSSVDSKNEEKTQVSPSPRETGAPSTCERLKAKVFWPLAFPHSGVPASKGT